METGDFAVSCLLAGLVVLVLVLLYKWYVDRAAAGKAAGAAAAGKADSFDGRIVAHSIRPLAPNPPQVTLTPGQAAYFTRQRRMEEPTDRDMLVNQAAALTGYNFSAAYNQTDKVLTPVGLAALNATQMAKPSVLRAMFEQRFLDGTQSAPKDQFANAGDADLSYDPSGYKTVQSLNRYHQTEGQLRAPDIAAAERMMQYAGGDNRDNVNTAVDSSANQFVSPQNQDPANLAYSNELVLDLVLDLVADPRMIENQKKWADEIAPWSMCPRQVDDLEMDVYLDFRGIQRPMSVVQNNPYFVTEIDAQDLSVNRLANFNNRA